MATPVQRLLALVGALLLLAMLVAGASVTPSPAGHGTHESLGMAPCPFLATTGVPCMTCGMTTAVSHLAHAQPVRAFRVQPVGALVGLGAAVGFWGCLHVAVFGSRLGRLVAPFLVPRVLWIGAALWTASWVYKIIVWNH